MRAVVQPAASSPVRRGAAVLGCALLLSVSAAVAADAGKAAPDIVLRGADGKAQQLSALRGKIVYLDFWASWCAPCRKSFPWMNELHKRFRERGLVVIAVNLDEKREDADAFLARYPAQFRIAYDAAATGAKSFGVKGMPTSFLIARDGTVIFEHKGYRESLNGDIEKEIRRALEQQQNAQVKGNLAWSAL